MEWLIGALVVAVAAWIGRRTGKAGIPALAHGLRVAESDRLEAEARYLECLRRDIALALLEADPRRLLEAHAIVASFTRDMRDGSAERREAERSALSLKYPRYADFDFFGLSHFVPVRPGDFEPADAVVRYVDIGRFLSLMAADRGTLKLATDEFLREDRKTLERVVGQSVDDARIRRTDEAMGRYHAWQQPGDGPEFEDREFRVERLPFDYTPELRFGVTFKDDGTHVVFGSYTFDDRPRTVHSYTLADADWRTVRHLSKWS